VVLLLSLRQQVRLVPHLQTTILVRLVFLNLLLVKRALLKILLLQHQLQLFCLVVLVAPVLLVEMAVMWLVNMDIQLSQAGLVVLEAQELAGFQVIFCFSQL